jgi:SAM-dependent methyltransferase
MEQADKRVILDRYANRISEFGHGAAAIGEPKGRQAFYFDFLLQADGITRSDSILDVGCGYGDLFGYLRATGWNGRYVGVDINSTLIDEGARRYPDADLRTLDIQVDSLESGFDWCICCHALTSDTKDIPFLDHFKSMVSIMWQKCEKGLIFNLLSPLADYTNPIHARPSFGDVLPTISSLTRRFTMRHDYMPFEYAVYAYKNEQINSEFLIFARHDELLARVRELWSPIGASE